MQYFLHLVSKSVELLSKAKRPLILMGSQSTLPPVKSDELVRAVNRLGIPCYLGGMSRGLLGANNPLQVQYSILFIFGNLNSFIAHPLK